LMRISMPVRISIPFVIRPQHDEEQHEFSPRTSNP
jgi:hypothetical protein